MMACVVAQLPAPSGGSVDRDRLPAVLSQFAPEVEWAEVSRAIVSYLDLGSVREPVEAAQAIGLAVREEAHLPAALGLAGGKFPAYAAAASAAPDEALIIAPGQEARFLAPLPVVLLPLDEEAAHRLHVLGLRTLGQLAALPVAALLHQLGMRGRLLHQLARGHDDRPVVGRRPEAVETALRHFDGPIAEREGLAAVFRDIAVELAERLRAGYLACREVRLTLYLDDHTVPVGRFVLRQPTSSPQRLAEILLGLLERAGIEVGVSEVEVTLAGLLPAVGQQLDLFAHGLEQGSRLREIVNDLAARYGPDCFYRVALSHPEAVLPERRFHLERANRHDPSVARRRVD